MQRQSSLPPSLEEKTKSLFIAVKKNNFEVAKILLQNGALTQVYEENTEHNCLHYAVLNRNAKMVKLLLQFKADTTLKNKAGLTPVGLALNKNYLDCLEAFTSCEEESTHKSDYGSALLEIVKKNNYSLAEKFLNAKALPTWHFSSTHNGCLYYAASNDNPAMIALLLKHGAKQDKRNLLGQTPLMIAAIENKSPHCIKAFFYPDLYYLPLITAKKVMMIMLLALQFDENTQFSKVSFEILEYIFRLAFGEYFNQPIYLSDIDKERRYYSVKALCFEYNSKIFTRRSESSKNFVTKLESTLKLEEKNLKQKNEMIVKQINEFKELKKAIPSRAISLLKKYRLFTPPSSHHQPIIPKKTLSK